jgi:hypothetical protein
MLTIHLVTFAPSVIVGFGWFLFIRSSVDCAAAGELEKMSVGNHDPSLSSTTVHISFVIPHLSVAISGIKLSSVRGWNGVKGYNPHLYFLGHGVGQIQQRRGKVSSPN